MPDSNVGCRLSLMERWEDKETQKQGDRQTQRHRDRETEETGRGGSAATTTSLRRPASGAGFYSGLSFSWGGEGDTEADTERHGDQETKTER